MEQEVFKPIVGYEDLYKVSNMGNFLSFHKGSWKKMKTTDHCTGYSIIGLVKGGKQKLFRAHRVVAAHFCEKKEGCNIVNHKNGIKRDNRAFNLAWTTPSGNSLHSFSIGLSEVKKGEKSNLSILKESDVIKIRNFYGNNIYNTIELSKIFNVSKSCINLIVNRVNWKHI